MKKLFFISLVLTLIITGCTLGKSKVKTLTIDEAKVTSANFINNNLVQKGSEVSIKEVTEEGEMYKVVVNMTNGQEVISYLSKDGKMFFPQAMDIAEIQKQNSEKVTQEQAAQTKEETSIAKSAKPIVEAFVMTHCPYGTQIEKGLIPVAQALGNKIDFSIKFCDYAMHGKKELDESLTQYCIEKNESAKYLTYLQCFLGGEDKSVACLKEAKIDEKRLSVCVSETDKQYRVTEKFNDKSTWSNGQFPTFDVQKKDNEKYGVGGSPTLVINGKTVSSSRDSASLLKLICSAFEKQPAECSKTLSAEAPSPGFGYSTSGSTGTAAGCAQ